MPNMCMIYLFTSFNVTKDSVVWTLRWILVCIWWLWVFEDTALYCSHIWREMFWAAILRFSLHQYEWDLRSQMGPSQNNSFIDIVQMIYWILRSYTFYIFIGLVYFVCFLFFAIRLVKNFVKIWNRQTQLFLKI